MFRCAVRWRYVEQMAADPRITSLRRSERAVWRLLSQLADDDGVVRKYLSARYLARRVEYQPDTVQKAIYVLEDKGLCRTTPGTGRTRSLYAVPAVLGAMIAEPEAPPPMEARSSAPTAGTLGAATGERPRTPASSATAADGASPQEPIPGIPRQTTPNESIPERSPSAPGLLQNRGESEDVPRELWCEAARLIGVPHKNRRCCHTTDRDKQRREAFMRQVERKRREAALVAEHRPLTEVPDEGRKQSNTRNIDALRAELASVAKSHLNPKRQAKGQV
jgi:hypothetical protein